MEPILDERPLATVIIPARNEENFIEPCLRSLVEQDYPQGKMEILVIDGLSEDKTVTIVENLALTHTNIKVLRNPDRIIPSALNIGIRYSTGQIILRADAHTTYAPDYVRKCIELLLSTGASNVGGVIKPIGTDLRSKSIAIAVSSPFGVGNAYHRFARKPMWVDSVAFGCWRKSTLITLGGYDETYLANEDYELNYRLRSKGGKILLSPEVKSRYFSQCSLRGLMRQYFRYGKWKVRMLVAYPESIVFRQAAPPLFVGSLLAALCLIPLSIIPFILVAGPYALLNLLFSCRAALKNGLKCCLFLPAAFFTIHISWGAGFFAGIKAFGFPGFIKALRTRKPRKAAASSYWTRDTRRPTSNGWF